MKWKQNKTKVMFLTHNIAGSTSTEPAFFISNMLYSIYINQSKLIEWKLTINEGIVLDWLTKKTAWFDKVTIGNNSWYWASRNLATKEIPCVSGKADTIYRIYKSLHDKGLIIYEKDGKKDLVVLTKKAESWNLISDGFESESSDLNPNKLGFKSENYSEINPTNNNKNIYNNINDNIEKQLKIAFDEYKNMRKKMKKEMTPHAEELAKEKLKKLSGNDIQKAIEILNQSILNGWQGLFELTQEKKFNAPGGGNFQETQSDKIRNAAMDAIKSIYS